MNKKIIQQDEIIEMLTRKNSSMEFNQFKENEKLQEINEKQLYFQSIWGRCNRRNYDFSQKHAHFVPPSTQYISWTICCTVESRYNEDLRTMKITLL